VLFGDGAGAVVMQAGTGRGDAPIAACWARSFIPTGACTTCSMSTADLRPRRRRAICACWAAKSSSMRWSTRPRRSRGGAGRRRAVSDIDWIVPHQANQRILDSTAHKLGYPPERVISTIAEHGNTSAASVPLALAAGIADGRIKRGDLLLLEAMGGGFTWGAALVRW
jgi:3-oxoacyl-[acyl-carrier-protein] synthase-3